MVCELLQKICLAVCGLSQHGIKCIFSKGKKHKIIIMVTQKKTATQAQDNKSKKPDNTHFFESKVPLGIPKACPIPTDVKVLFNEA